MDQRSRIIDALKVRAAMHRQNAPLPGGVGSPQSRAYVTAMGEAVKCERLADEIEHSDDAIGMVPWKV